MSPWTFGPALAPNGVTFRLWAPAAKKVELLLDRLLPMQRDADGWCTIVVSDAGLGTRYQFRIDGKTDVPDPASAFQPHDVSGPSEVINHESHRWRATEWRGRPWEEAVLLETHVGAFTPEGTYRSVIEKLDRIVDAGFTAVELMPLADFSGRRNWGYDGVLWYAPDSVYGRPDDLKAFIDEAHLRGLMVFLDVVYNHFGPEGNYLPLYAPSFFTAAQTPWGGAIDYRVPEVRQFAIENALYWLKEYRFDGLRLDAVHAIVERGDPSVLMALSDAVGKLSGEAGRHIHLVLENDDNHTSLLDPRRNPPGGQYRAQWNDDYHHAWHVALTNETYGYYEDYSEEPRRQILRILTSGFAYQGEPSQHRDGRLRGEPSGTMSPLGFVNFLQNHDQIGNRALGDRLQASGPAIEAVLAITLLAPMPPLMFMGEEWGSRKPFPFFCDFHDELADAVRKGRRNEFKAAYAKLGDAMPDPLDEETFRSAVLDWGEREASEGQARLTLVKRLLQIRHREIVPRLSQAAFGRGDLAGDALSVSWQLGPDNALHLLANVSDREAPRPGTASVGRALWGGEPPPVLPPWSVFWRVEGA